MKSMKIRDGKVSELTILIERDLMERSGKEIDKRIVYNLAECAACALIQQSSNSYEWITALPRGSAPKSKETFIRRVLSSPLISVAVVMSFYVKDIVKKLLQKVQEVILMIDQSQIRDGFEVLMVSLRLGNRAIPILWKVVKTEGAIGFEVQEELLEEVKKILPPGAKIFLSADRFYGTKSLVELCQNNGWGYRIRLKSNLIFYSKGTKITAGEVGEMPESKACGVTFNNSEVKTNIGYLHEKGHKEPWIIAMSCEPTKEKILEYGKRWGIECLFSDFKSRGFGITDTHVTAPDRLEKLILILTIGLYWATSIGGEKESKAPENKPRSKCSWFKTGLRSIMHTLLFVSLSFSHILWSFI